MLRRPHALLFGLGLVFVLLGGLIMSHFGLSERSIIAVLTPAILMIPLAAGLRAANSSLLPFFADEHSATAAQNSYALGAIVIALGLIFYISNGFAGSFSALAAGSSIGLCLNAYVFAPALRRCEGFSVLQWLDMHFDNRLLRLILRAALLATAALVVLTAMETAIRSVASAFGLSHVMAVAATAIVAGVLTISGGVATILAVLGSSWIIVIAAAALPFILQGYEVPPELTTGASWSAFWRGQNWQYGVVAALGVAALPMIQVPAIASAGPREARRSVVQLLMSLIALSIIIAIWLDAPATSGQADLSAGLRLFGGFQGPISALHPVSESLAVAASLLLPIGLTMVALHVLAANLTEGTPRNKPEFQPLSGTRLARMRLCVVVAVAVAGAILVRYEFDAGLLLQWALGVAAVCLAPAMLIASALSGRASFALAGAYLATFVATGIYWMLDQGLAPPRWGIGLFCVGALAATTVSVMLVWKSDRAAKG